MGEVAATIRPEDRPEKIEIVGKIGGALANGSETARVAFLFKDGRRGRIGQPGPREFFYGATELPGLGLPVAVLEEGELGAGFEPPFLESTATALAHGLFGLNANSLRRVFRRSVLAELNRFDVIVATTNAQGLALAAARAAGRLSSRVLLIAMGLLPLGAPSRHRAIYRRLLRHVSLVTLSRGEESYLRQRLGPAQNADYLPFGVDLGFWTAENEVQAEQGDYVLSIGNDSQRDYATLATAWAPDFPWLKIVTQRPVPSSAGDVEVVRGDWTQMLLSDEEVRRLYRGARFVVLPLRQSVQPSGQSACLQAMACGKAVIISDTAGLWDRTAMQNGETCVLIPPSSPRALATSVENLLRDPERAVAIGRRARAAVERYFGLDRMSAALKVRLDLLLDKNVADGATE